jgi:hypothetical protein
MLIFIYYFLTNTKKNTKRHIYDSKQTSVHKKQYESNIFVHKLHIPTVAINAVDAVPPNESCNKRVNLLSRYGMCVTFCSANAAITFPSADKLVLMLFASDNRVPLLTVRRTRSEPSVWCTELVTYV